MKWAFLLGSPDISGGTYVIFEHAIRNMKRGEDVYIITLEEVSMDRLYWHPEAKNLKWRTYDQVKNEVFDVAIATWWRTIFDIHKINAKSYVYFVQSIESKFYPKKEKVLRNLVESTYLIPFTIITEATWIKEYLEEKYNLDVLLVHNGIRKDIYQLEGDKYEKSEGLRVLVEGPVDVPFKNVPKTIKLAKKSNADEIWLLSSSKIKKYKGIDRVFSQVPITEVAKIYRSCDVIVKLSYVEGMFGPPLEMFHCGGTAITYDVTGHDEYIVNGVNGLVAKRDDEERVVEYINMLKANPNKLQTLKQNAIQTAENWIDWEESSIRFGEAIYKAASMSRVTQEELKHKSKFLFDYYVVAERKRFNLVKDGNLRNLAKYIEFKFPNVTKKIVKILKFLHINITVS
ncbi:glycosyltransferase family 4 protein [Turicibacter sanguinis]|uniref:glycosyltransferase family 4 protein n=1 Tax=Turicibacter sanguinis TaxID=154288 RepID=UPI0018AC530A|nr:glycosyltransferase family 4 protein [Turicibacter sanguinis]MDB8558562.1 glycosyltransferase family 4 protein [Turicibacter sanguinis]MDB8561358.1 glycosyltransferase family 4 protein [Turicibacter sanguinis]